MVEIPLAPVSSDDQKASRSWPMGVATPAATTATRWATRSRRDMGRAHTSKKLNHWVGMRAHRALQRGDHCRRGRRGSSPDFTQMGGSTVMRYRLSGVHDAVRGHHRAPAARREHEWADGERRRSPEELDQGVAALAGGPVALHGHRLVAPERGEQAEGGRRMPAGHEAQPLSLPSKVTLEIRVLFSPPARRGRAGRAAGRAAGRRAPSCRDAR